MDRREFIKKAAGVTAGGLLLMTPFGRLYAHRPEREISNTLKHKKRNMKVLLINGSPHRRGNTFTALSEVAKTLEQQGIESEIVHLGVKPVRGCIACNQCKADGLGRCVFDDDICNRIVEKLADTDGLIIGSPVYYGQPNGSVLSLMQRMFYAAGALVQNKPAAAVCVCRRGGATAAYQTLNMPFEMMNMPVVTSQYWNIAYGRAEGEAGQDAEGMQTMRTLANNMAWLLKKIHADGNPDYPEREAWQGMNFIR
jgi:multimeric flavodoxin WrbA